MEDEEIKARLGRKIAESRRKAGLTQAALGELLGYSDKAVSKWERGESVPDVVTLMHLAEQLNLPVQELLGLKPVKPPKPGRIPGLCTALVWFLGLLGYVLGACLGLPHSWVFLLWAIPVNAVVLLSVQSARRDYRQNFLYVSLILWGVLAGLYATLLVYLHINIRSLFLLGLPGQAAIWLWFPKKEDKHG